MVKTILLLAVIAMVRPATAGLGVATGTTNSTGKNIYQYTELNREMPIFTSFNAKFGFDQFNDISIAIHANQTNYSFSLFCHHDTNWLLTIYYFTCGLDCYSSHKLDSDNMFINYCEFHLWHDDAHPGIMNSTLLFDLYINITYEGNVKQHPFDVSTPTPQIIPSPSPPLPKQVGGLSSIAVAGITAGVMLVLGGLIVGGYFGYKWWSQRGVQHQ